MSQKVVIERVQVRGAAPYLGLSATEDGQQVPLYSTNPDVVMRWLCEPLRRSPQTDGSGRRTAGQPVDMRHKWLAADARQAF